MEAIITLATDFGSTDAYVAAMKGVLLSINPQAKLIDICHATASQDIFYAAFVFSTAYAFFPTGTIHLVVVDPGVGSDRRAIILKTPSAFFVAPDNGVLSYVIQDYRARYEDELTTPRHVELKPEVEAINITNPRYWRSPVSPTFHGRDIFAPVAAHLSLKVSMQEFGERVNSITMLPLPHPYQDTDGSLIGHILHIDSFGNLITDIEGSELSRQAIVVEVSNRIISGLNCTYAAGNNLMMLIGSSGRLEIAIRNGSAARLLKINVGDTIRLRYLSDG